jgi:NADH:ubiquinone oxidoreductase subunit E
MAKTPTRSVTHEDIELGKLAALGLDVEEVADGERVTLAALIELAEEQGRPVSHFLAAIPLATELQLAPTPSAKLAVRVCAGTCQRWGALDLLDHLAARAERTATFSIAPVTCLDRCDLAPACELHSPDGTVVLAPATAAALDEAIDTLA